MTGVGPLGAAVSVLAATAAANSLSSGWAATAAAARPGTAPALGLSERPIVEKLARGVLVRSQCSSTRPLYSAFGVIKGDVHEGGGGISHQKKKRCVSLAVLSAQRNGLAATSHTAAIRQLRITIQCNQAALSKTPHISVQSSSTRITMQREFVHTPPSQHSRCATAQHSTQLQPRSLHPHITQPAAHPSVQSRAHPAGSEPHDRMTLPGHPPPASLQPSPTHSWISTRPLRASWRRRWALRLSCGRALVRSLRFWRGLDPMGGSTWFVHMEVLQSHPRTCLRANPAVASSPKTPSHRPSPVNCLPPCRFPAATLPSSSAVWPSCVLWTTASSTSSTMRFPSATMPIP
eukprot:m.41143 g.41143  ORF g.41143 m.41143 type:complete len:348 (+) comp6032_c0_seq1:1202-2245(+)